MMGADSTVACVPGAIDPNHRQTHFDLLRRLFGDRLLERTAPDELPNGYEFRFNSEAFVELMQFVANERLCCPFLAFELSMAPNQGPICLKISGPPGTRSFLDAELPVTR